MLFMGIDVSGKHKMIASAEDSETELLGEEVNR